MNILLWILQIALGLHTVTGAVWKFTNSEQSIPSLKVIPHGAWMALSVLEILCSLGLLLAFLRPVAMFAPIAAACIAVEMLLFCGLHFSSGQKEHGTMYYWLAVAVLAAFVAYGRFVLKPL